MFDVNSVFNNGNFTSVHLLQEDSYPSRRRSLFWARLWVSRLYLNPPNDLVLRLRTRHAAGALNHNSARPAAKKNEKRYKSSFINCVKTRTCIQLFVLKPASSDVKRYTLNQVFGVILSINNINSDGVALSFADALLLQHLTCLIKNNSNHCFVCFFPAKWISGITFAVFVPGRSVRGWEMGSRKPFLLKTDYG